MLDKDGQNSFTQCTDYTAHVRKCTIWTVLVCHAYRTYCAYSINSLKIEQIVWYRANLCTVCESVLRNYARRSVCLCAECAGEPVGAAETVQSVWTGLICLHTAEVYRTHVEPDTHNMTHTHTPTEARGNRETR